MKKAALSLFLLVSANFCFSQWEPHTVLPPTFLESTYVEADLVDVTLESYDADTFEEAAAKHALDNRYLVGRVFDLHQSWASLEELHTLNDGSQVSRITFKVDNASGMSFVIGGNHFDGEIFVYNSEKSFWNGPFTAEDIHSSHLLIPDCPGGTVTLELHNQGQQADLTIERLTALHRGITVPEEILAKVGGSQPCQVNVNCPEGEDWSEERDAIVRLNFDIDGQSFLCSGALVNNTAEDGKGYILSSEHCFQSGSAVADFSGMIVRWNFERPNCNGGFAPTNHQMMGVNVVASSNDGGGDSGSDFTLLELEDPIPAAWDPFWAGWTSAIAPAQTGVGIHHPSGDIKKISTFNNPLLSVTLGAPGSHWRVIWSATETNHGVTEGGSSGSPIFNADHKIVGTLTGGGSFCDDPLAPDFYGKFNYHWTLNGSSADEQLKPWLDPTQSNVFEIDGTYNPENTASVNEGIKRSLRVYPNPSSDFLNIAASQGQEITSIAFYNVNGQSIKTETTKGFFVKTDISMLAPGLYSLVLTWENGDLSTAKVLIEN